MTVEPKTISWMRSLEEALEQARARHQHILLDFSAAPM